MTAFAMGGKGPGPPATIVEQTTTDYNSICNPHRRTPKHMIVTAGKLASLAARTTEATELGFEVASWSATRIGVPMSILAELFKGQATKRAPMQCQLGKMMALQRHYQAASRLQDSVDYGSGCIDGRYLIGAQPKAESA